MGSPVHLSLCALAHYPRERVEEENLCTTMQQLVFPSDSFAG